MINNTTVRQTELIKFAIRRKRAKKNETATIIQASKQTVYLKQINRLP